MSKRRRVVRAKRTTAASREDYVVVERHPPFFRFWHWTTFIIGIFIILTGLEIYAGAPYWNILGSYHDARALHLLLSLFIGFWALPVLLYYLAAIGDLRNILLGRGDMKWQMDNVKNFVGRSPTYPEHSTYDVHAHRWYRKYNPGQKILFLGDIIALIVVGLTGLAMYSPTAFAPVITIFDWLTLGGMAGVRAIHYLLLYYFVVTTIVHAYLGMVPANWPVLKSMVRGKARFRVHRSRSK